jgi:hypothetical protein
VHVSITEETATVVRHTVQYAVSRHQDVQAALPMLIWVADHRRAPVVMALEACRRELAGSPASITLAREVVMLEHAVDAPNLV